MRNGRAVAPSLANAIISGCLGSWYGVTEPLRLELARQRNERRFAVGSRDPLISIIIATYNRSRILTERTIPAILRQTYGHFEIVVVGDKCVDDTAQATRRISDPRVRFFDLPARGRYPDDPRDRWFVQGSVPRNKGLNLARGEWIGVISDDDIMLAHQLETMLRFAQSGGYEFVSAKYTHERDGHVHVEDASSFEPRIGGMQTWLYRSYLNCFRWNRHSWRKRWNRPCDYDLQLRMYRAGVRFGFLDEVVAHVPAVEGTASTGLAAHMALEGVAACAEYW